MFLPRLTYLQTNVVSAGTHSCVSPTKCGNVGLLPQKRLVKAPAPPKNSAPRIIPIPSAYPSRWPTCLPPKDDLAVRSSAMRGHAPQDGLDSTQRCDQHTNRDPRSEPERDRSQPDALHHRLGVESLEEPRVGK